MSRVREAECIWRQGGARAGLPSSPSVSCRGASSASDKDRGWLLQPWHLSEESLNK